jgi:hypothetical protein
LCVIVIILVILSGRWVVLSFLYSCIVKSFNGLISIVLAHTITTIFIVSKIVTSSLISLVATCLLKLCTWRELRESFTWWISKFYSQRRTVTFLILIKICLGICPLMVTFFCNCCLWLLHWSLYYLVLWICFIFLMISLAILRLLWS